jgi:hypothetical protein
MMTAKPQMSRNRSKTHLNDTPIDRTNTTSQSALIPEEPIIQFCRNLDVGVPLCV